MIFEAQCMICGSKGGDALLERGDHRLVRCWECGYAAVLREGRVREERAHEEYLHLCRGV